MSWFGNLGRDRPWAQGCVIAGAGLALAATSCFGFLLTLDFNGRQSPLAEVASIGVAIVFGISALAVQVGLIWFIVGLVRKAAQGDSAAPPAPQPPPPPPPPPPAAT